MSAISTLWITLGTWNNVEHLNMSRVQEVVNVINPINVMANRTFVVTSIENAPYTMLKEETKKLQGNDRLILTMVFKRNAMNFSL